MNVAGLLVAKYQESLFALGDTQLAALDSCERLER
jgi:hypothetical protein